MDRRTTSWFCAVFLGLSVLVAFIYFAMPQNTPDPMGAIPKPAEGSPHVLFSGKGSIISKYLVDGLSGRSGAVLKLIPRSIRSAFLLDMSDEEDFYGSFVFASTVAGSLNNLRLPPSWGDIFDGSRLSTVKFDEFDCLQLLIKPSLNPVYCVVHDDLVLVASSPEGLKRMLQAKISETESPQSFWKIEPYWDGHMRVDLRAIYGERDDIWGYLAKGLFHCAWRKGNGGSGAFSWKFDSLPPSSLTTEEWLYIPQLPDPLYSVVGVSSLNEVLGYPLPWSGPFILSSGGEGGILSVPFPGLLMAILDSSGHKLSKKLMKGPWGDYNFKPFSSDLYPRGWSTSSPATLTIADWENGSLVGIIDRKSLRTFKSLEMDAILPQGWRDSFAWGYMNGPYFSKTLEGLVKSGRLLFPEQGGLSPLSGMESLISLTRKMRGIGVFCFVLPSISEGSLLWR